MRALANAWQIWKVFPAWGPFAVWGARMAIDKSGRSVRLPISAWAVRVIELANIERFARAHMGRVNFSPHGRGGWLTCRLRTSEQPKAPFL